MASQPVSPSFVLRGHHADVQCLSFLASRGWLISGDADGEIRVWDLDQQRPLYVQRCHSHYAGIIAVSILEGHQAVLLSEGRDGLVCGWLLAEDGSLSRDPVLRIATGCYNFCRISTCLASRSWVRGAASGGMTTTATTQERAGSPKHRVATGLLAQSLAKECKCDSVADHDKLWPETPGVISKAELEDDRQGLADSSYGVHPGAEAARASTVAASPLGSSVGDLRAEEAEARFEQDQSRLAEVSSSLVAEAPVGVSGSGLEEAGATFEHNQSRLTGAGSRPLAGVPVSVTDLGPEEAEVRFEHDQSRLAESGSGPVAEAPVSISGFERDLEGDAGKALLSRSDDKIWLMACAGPEASYVQVWDLEAQSVILKLIQPSTLTSWGMAMSVELLRKEQSHAPWVLAGYEAGVVALWLCSQPAAPVAWVRAHDEPVMALAASPNATEALSGSADVKLVCISLEGPWCGNLNDGRPLSHVETQDEKAAPRSTWVNGPGSANKEVPMATASLAITATCDIPTAGTAGVEYRSDGKIIAAASWDGRVRLFSAKSKKPLAVLKYHTRHATSVSFSPDARWLATASRDATIALWTLYQPT